MRYKHTKTMVLEVGDKVRYTHFRPYMEGVITSLPYDGGRYTVLANYRGGSYIRPYTTYWMDYEMEYVE